LSVHQVFLTGTRKTSIFGTFNQRNRIWGWKRTGMVSLEMLWCSISLSTGSKETWNARKYSMGTRKSNSNMWIWHIWIWMENAEIKWGPP